MKVGITGTIRDEKTKTMVRNVLEMLRERSVPYILEQSFAESLGIDDADVTFRKLGSESEVIVTFGGDGTLLNVAKAICPSDTPILGVNTGHLGFLTEFPPEMLPAHFEDLLSGKYEIEQRMMVEARILGRENEKYLAVNDIVIDKGGFARSMKASLSIDREFCHVYSSDGIIVATATGSTAYSLSAGGPIVYPTIDNIIITPVCPHTLTARPMIVPDSVEVEITIVAGPKDVSIQADGQDATRLRVGETVCIGKSDSSFNLVHFPAHNFFRVLRT